MARQKLRRTNFFAWLGNFASASLIGVSRLLPYRWRVPAFGWMMSQVIAPLTGARRRVRANLAYVMPELTDGEVETIVRAVPDNIGRSLIEIYAGQEFLNHVKDIEPTGDGVDALVDAGKAGTPVVLVTGHFGNYDAPRGWLAQQGFKIGGLYNPMQNAYFNAHYVEAISTLAEPVFARDRHGLAGMIKFLREGGMVGMVIDQHMNKGEVVDFFGKPALTALSAAEMALKYKALLVPIYGIRQPDGLSFDIRIEKPIAHSDAMQMTRALNDSLEALVRAHMGQWMWTHRRWKVENPKKRR
ncbi:MAG: lysophospholipid acyltransferase family protein [Deltaproteobacteria bacterium]